MNRHSARAVTDLWEKSVLSFCVYKEGIYEGNTNLGESQFNDKGSRRVFQRRDQSIGRIIKETKL